MNTFIKTCTSPVDSSVIHMCIQSSSYPRDIFVLTSHKLGQCQACWTRPRIEVEPNSNHIHRLLLTIICPTALPRFHFQLSKMTVAQLLSEVCTGTYSTPSQVSNIVPSPGNVHINVILDCSGLVQPRFADFQRSFAQPTLAPASDLYSGICCIIKTNKYFQ